MPDAVERMAELVSEREKANSRLRDTEREQRSAREELRAARHELAESVRRGGGRPAERKALEEKLARAEARAAEPWAPRLEGLRLAIRDADARVREHVQAHLPELVAPLEERGDEIAARMSDAASTIVEGHQEWWAVSREISALWAMVTTPRRGDTADGNAEKLVQEASAALSRGIAPPALLRRDHPAFVELEDQVPA
jgi:hypothetical protein